MSAIELERERMRGDDIEETLRTVRVSICDRRWVGWRGRCLRDGVLAVMS
jgi:hypothetical protein